MLVRNAININVIVKDVKPQVLESMKKDIEEQKIYNIYYSFSNNQMDFKKNIYVIY